MITRPRGRRSRGLWRAPRDGGLSWPV